MFDNLLIFLLVILAFILALVFLVFILIPWIVVIIPLLLICYSFVECFKFFFTEEPKPSKPNENKNP